MDIDIDCQSTFDPTTLFDVVQASMVKNGELVRHPVGVYFQEIPKDRITGLSAIPYDAAEEVGYFKIDFLHLSVLDSFGNKEEIRALSRIPPDWNLLSSKSIVSKLFQLANHYDIVTVVQPRSVQELADCVALIRPGKRNLLKGYLKDRVNVRPLLYEKTDKYFFKRSHAIAYAVTIVLQLHLIKGGLL
jgi:hypothetical protein